jgi:uncharacterized protein (TIGR00369 family)
MTEPVTIESVQAMLDASPFIASLHLQVLSIDADKQEIAVKMPFRKELERRPGTGQFHGGPIAALIDIVGDYALVLQTGGPVPTINFRTDYLRPAIDTDLTATGRVRRAGRTVAVIDIDVEDDQGRLVATGRGTYSTQIG